MPAARIEQTYSWNAEAMQWNQVYFPLPCVVRTCSTLVGIFVLLNLTFAAHEYNHLSIIMYKMLSA